MLTCGTSTTADLLSEVNKNAQYREALEALYKAQGYNNVFFFADGFTYTESNDVGIYEDGTAWTYADEGALPVTITAGTVPSAGVYSAVLMNSAEAITTGDGRSVEERLNAIPNEVDAAGTAASLVQEHNSSTTAHPELSSFITSEADRAEAAADAANLNADIYETTAIGIAETVDGDYFSVVSSDDNSYLDLYKNEAGVAVYKKSYPSYEYVRGTASKADFNLPENIGEYSVGSYLNNDLTIPTTSNAYGPEPIEGSVNIDSIIVDVTQSGVGTIEVLVSESNGRSYDVVKIISTTFNAGVNTIPVNFKSTNPLGVVQVLFRTGVGSKLRYSAVDTGYRVVSNVLSEGDIVGRVNGYSNSVSIEVEYTRWGSSLDEDVKTLLDGTSYEQSAIKAQIGKDNQEYKTTFGSVGQGTDGAIPSGYLVAPYKPRDSLSFLTEITLELSATLDASTVYILDKLYEGFVVRKKILLYPTKLVDTYHFDYEPINAGGIVCISTSRVKYTQGNQFNTPMISGNVGELNVGDEVTLNNYVNSVSMAIEIVVDDNSLQASIEKIKAEVVSLSTDNSKPVTLSESVLNNIDTDSFAFTGDWMNTPYGVKSPTVGSWDTYFIDRRGSSLSERTITASFLVSDVNSKFGVCTKPPENSGGAVAVVDGADNTLSIRAWNGISEPVTYESASIPELVAGRVYNIVVVKEWLASKVTLIDTVTHERVVVDSPDRASGYKQWHGQYGVMFFSGDITVNWLMESAPKERRVHALVIGDSNAEGNFLNVGEQTWAHKLGTLHPDDVVVAARGGDETTNFKSREFYDLMSWKPRYVILALGTNDSSQSLWRKNIAELISNIESIGGTPVLCTQPPRTSLQSLRDSMNEDITSLYFGNYRYINFASAVSLNNDMKTWNPAYNYGDSIHANQLGQDEMLSQLFSDSPYIFDS